MINKVILKTVDNGNCLVDAILLCLYGPSQSYNTDDDDEKKHNIDCINLRQKIQDTLKIYL